MKFIAAGYSDTGNVKEINQDSLLIKIAQTSAGMTACCIVCDGMGGLKSGEVASAFVINTFNDWFNRCLPSIIRDSDNINLICDNWKNIIKECNYKIMEYGRSNGFNIGTTITGIIIIGDKYLTINVGDSRVYMLTDKAVKLTRDQTVVENEIAAGRLTKQEAKEDPRRSVLLQCIGATENVVPEFTRGTLSSCQTIVVCSDGFRHEISEDEMYACLSSKAVMDEQSGRNNLIQLTKLVKQRGERDNITAAVIKAYSGI